MEYYIKATSNLEKVKVPADRGLAFLMDCKLTEKQVSRVWGVDTS